MKRGGEIEIIPLEPEIHDAEAAGEDRAQFDNIVPGSPVTFSTVKDCLRVSASRSVTTRTATSTATSRAPPT